MRCPESNIRSFFLPVLLAVAGVLQGAPDNKSTNGQKIDLPVPIGEPVKGIKIPQYDENGKLTMNLIADDAKKLDDSHVEFGKLKVQFSGNDEKDIVVEIPHSILNLESKVLVADSETTITRDDFQIVGQSAEFNTSSRRGEFKGRVHASFSNPSGVNVP